jgi:hyperosmotically inducible protein
VVKNTNRFLLAPGIALMMAAISGPVMADDAVSQKIIDAREDAQIRTTYALNPYLRANDLSVTVRGGKATIAGNVDEGAEKDLAKQIALGVSGINDVDNQIVVQPGYVPPTESTSRSYGQTIDESAKSKVHETGVTMEDGWITAKVKSTLLYSSNVDSSGITVKTNAGIVTLSGKAASGPERALAVELTGNVRAVKSVYSKGMMI